MKSVFVIRVPLIVAIAITAGCSEKVPSPKEPPAVTPASESSVTSAAMESWLGEWTGPEGTSLTLSKSGDGYRVTIQSLDGPALYDGKAVGDHIEFARNGKIESIRATDGKGTGMKWLQEKTNCLTIQLSEGFCRD